MDSLVIVDVFTSIVSAMEPNLNKLGINLTFIYGRQPKILNQLIELKRGITTGDNVYPLLLLYQPFPEVMGGDYYATIKFPKIDIVALSNPNDYAPARYTSSIKPLLYPIYEELKKQIVRSPFVTVQNGDYIPHTKTDRPGDPPLQKDADGKSVPITDYFDSIIITDLTLTFQKNTNCKQ